MKRIILLGALLLACSGVTLHAQAKIGWVNLAAIMEKLPEAQDAQRKVDNLVADWQAELAKMQNTWMRKKDEYDKKKLILTDQLRADAEKELEQLDRQISDYRTKKFGQNGELFAKQNELMKPVQNKVFKVIQDIAAEDDYDYILDKSADVIIMYSKEKYDLTSKVLEKLLTFGK
jgi:outer membrane protein